MTIMVFSAVGEKEEQDNLDRKLVYSVGLSVVDYSINYWLEILADGLKLSRYYVDPSLVLPSKPAIPQAVVDFPSKSLSKAR